MTNMIKSSGILKGKIEDGLEYESKIRSEWSEEMQEFIVENKMKIEFDISQIWNVDKVKSISPIKDNVSKIITITDKQYILKVKTNINKIKIEYELLNFLKTSGIPVTAPIKTRKEELYFNNNEDSFCLYNYLEGENIFYNYTDDNKKVLRNYGKALGKLHKSLSEFKPENFKIEDMNLEESIFNWAIPEIMKNKSESRIVEIIEKVGTEMKDFYEELPKQFIHRDPNNQNILFKEDELSGFIDFELCMIGFKSFDLCYMMTGILMEGFMEERNREKWLELISEITEGYESENKIEEIEKESFWYMFISIQLTFIAYFYSIANKEIAEINLKGLYWIYDNKKRILDRIIV